MAPTGSNPAVAAKQLPPLPPPSFGPPGEPSAQGSPSPLAAALGSMGPLMASVQKINDELGVIEQSGLIPGVMQLTAQIKAAVNSLIPLAAQNVLQPMGGVGGGGAGEAGGIAPMPPPPGPPQPMTGSGA